MHRHAVHIVTYIAVYEPSAQRLLGPCRVACQGRAGELARTRAWARGWIKRAPSATDCCIFALVNEVARTRSSVHTSAAVARLGVRQQGY